MAHVADEAYSWIAMHYSRGDAPVEHLAVVRAPGDADAEELALDLAGRGFYITDIAAAAVEDPNVSDHEHVAALLGHATVSVEPARVPVLVALGEDHQTRALTLVAQLRQAGFLAVLLAENFPNELTRLIRGMPDLVAIRRPQHSVKIAELIRHQLQYSVT